MTYSGALMKKSLLVALFVLGCSAEAEKKLADFKKEAEERVAKLETEAKSAKSKLADAEQQLNEAKTQLTDAKTKLEEAEKAAKAGADEQAKLAEAAIGKARQAFKDKAKLQLTEVNKELNELGARAGKAPAKAKTAFTKAMQDVKKQQTTVAKDIAAFDTATLETFKAVNAKVQTSLAVLKNKIHAAGAKLPKS